MDIVPCNDGTIYHVDENSTKNSEDFYENAKQYWSKVPPTLDGMLGGFGYISQIDIQGSKVFLKQIFKNKEKDFNNMVAIDCGAGIGRITKHLLAPLFGRVDMVEQNSEFLLQAEQYIGPRLFNKIGERYDKGLQDFVPEDSKYDLIWNQWVLGHLKDEDLVQFLLRCKKGLKPNGFIVVKENIASTTKIDLDDQDSSVTRPLHLLRFLFSEAGLYCFKQVKQTNFPKGLYTVIMFALKPKTNFETEFKNDIYSSNKTGSNSDQNEIILPEETNRNNDESIVHTREIDMNECL